jgi:hypothetical protein
MAITLTITDNADDSGGVATITGSAVGSTNTLYRALMTGLEEALTWASAGTRTGDGTISITGPIGNYYLWQVQSDNAGSMSVSPVVLQSLTNANYTAVRTRLVDAVVDKLKLLSLDQIGNDVFIRNSFDDPNVKYPSVVVVRDATPDLYTGGTNVRDDVEYPIQVIFLDVSDMRDNAPVERWDLWKERSERAFRNQRIAGVSEVIKCTVEPSVTMAESLPPIYQKARFSFTLRFTSREVRGLQS